MVGIYLSGTGNTEHCLRKLVLGLDSAAEVISIASADAAAAIAEHEEIFLAYPTQFSNIPYKVKDFIVSQKTLWKGKKVFCLTTMGLFSGDGTGCAARLLRKYGAVITGGLQILMPDSVCDSKLLKKPLEKNREIIAEADKKIDLAIGEIKAGNYPKEGLSFPAHLAGLFGQRLWFRGKTKSYSRKLRISNACVGCGLCAGKCPMGNIEIKNGRAVAGDRCTMCYSCISLCPKQAVTLLGKQVVEQYRFEKMSCSSFSASDFISH